MDFLSAARPKNCSPGTAGVVDSLKSTSSAANYANAANRDICGAQLIVAKFLLASVVLLSITISAGRRLITDSRLKIRKDYES